MTTDWTTIKIRKDTFELLKSVQAYFNNCYEELGLTFTMDNSITAMFGKLPSSLQKAMSKYKSREDLKKCQKKK